MTDLMALRLLYVLFVGRLAQRETDAVSYLIAENRTLRGCGNALLLPRRAGTGAGGIRRRPRLGGLLNYYERAA